MRKILYVMFVGMLSLTSCNSWLDVKPETEVEIDDMFSQQQGFVDALIGAYIEMQSGSAYGGNLVYGEVEYLAQHWDYVSADTKSEALCRYNWLDNGVETALESMYTMLYTIIARVNVILERIDAKQDIFDKGVYEIVKGEALAIRAMCHLDVLRLFGPIPEEADGASILPYVCTITTEYHDRLPYEVYVALLAEDLDEAEKLLETSDPIVGHALEDMKNVELGDLRNRHYRMNYYSVLGLQARFRLWVGEKEKAYTYATKVIDAKSETGHPIYRLGESADIAAYDYAFSCEHVFGLHIYDMYSNVNRLFKEAGTVRYKKSKVELQLGLYPSGTTDIRFTRLWTEVVASNGDRHHVIKKFWQEDGDSGNEGGSKAMNMMPLIRLAEMYLIAMECGTIEQCNALYETFCLSRDIPVTTLQIGMLRDKLLEEYNKEFYGEGQMFFLYKRLNEKSILWAQDEGNASVYVLPVPDSDK